ncbi:MAG TPA: AAA family ATPase, partial [Saprospiraceae bacterium]|nr:AAA family ATPase [Saprospiraceae bacterium]
MADLNATNDQSSDVQAVDELNKTFLQITERMGDVIVGQEDVIEQLLVALLCRGHCILEGVPGLAKTLTVSTLASLLNQSFRRIQFTPDLMPADITGTEI